MELLQPNSIRSFAPHSVWSLQTSILINGHCNNWFIFLGKLDDDCCGDNFMMSIKNGRTYEEFPKFDELDFSFGGDFSANFCSLSHKICKLDVLYLISVTVFFSIFRRKKKQFAACNLFSWMQVTKQAIYVRPCINNCLQSLVIWPLRSLNIRRWT